MNVFTNNNNWMYQWMWPSESRAMYYSVWQWQEGRTSVTFGMKESGTEGAPMLLRCCCSCRPLQRKWLLWSMSAGILVNGHGNVPWLFESWFNLLEFNLSVNTAYTHLHTATQQSTSLIVLLIRSFIYTLLLQTNQQSADDHPHSPH